MRFFFENICSFSFHHGSGVFSLCTECGANDIAVIAKKDKTSLYEDTTVDILVNGEHAKIKDFWIDCYPDDEPMDASLLTNGNYSPCVYFDAWNPPYEKYLTVDMGGAGEYRLPLTVRTFLVDKNEYTEEEMLFNAQTGLDIGNDDDALMWTSFAVSCGSSEAKLMLAKFYEDGLCGLDQDAYHALELYMSLATKGHAEAELTIADHYYNGIGIAQNKETAKTWYEKAAKHSSDEAAKRLKDYFG